MVYNHDDDDGDECVKNTRLVKSESDVLDISAGIYR